MIAIEVELLTGRYVATSFADRSQPEWPPHPARLFSALLATAHEHDELADAGRRALQWLEDQGAPRIVASDAEARTVLANYVPDNTTRVLGDWSKPEAKLDEATASLSAAEERGDAKAVTRARKAVEKAKAKLDVHLVALAADDGRSNPSAISNAEAMLPDRRGKQPKTLPSVTPHDPKIRYEWPDASPEPTTEAALAELARHIARLGHSSSLVACRVVADSTSEQKGDERLLSWAPAASGTERLRTVTAGQVVRLERAFERHRGVEPRQLPTVELAYERERPAPPEPTRSVFGEMIVLREIAPPEGGRRVGLYLSRTEDVTRAARGALLHHAGDPPPAVLSGHLPGGAPLQEPHVAFVALGDVAAPPIGLAQERTRTAPGTILGIGIVLPRSIDPDDRRAVLRAIGRWESDGLHLRLGRIGALHLERIVDRDPRSTLDPTTWSRPSRRWATVTAIALDQNPGDLLSRDPTAAARAAERAEEIVARSCERIGLPAPAWVQVMRRSVFAAAPEALRFMPFPRNGGRVGSRRGQGPGTGSAFRRVCVHAELCFTKAVEGPLVLGAGRYFGLGLCRQAASMPR